MKVRHRPPSLVSMWMLDVFCCALGCVTLLWLLKTREAGFALEETSQVREQLITTRNDLDEQNKTNRMLKDQLDDQAKELALVEKERDEKAKQLALVQQERDQTAKKLAMSQLLAEATDAELKTAKTKLDNQAAAISDLEKKYLNSDDELAKKKKDLELLMQKAETAQKNTEELQRLLRKKEDEALATTKRIKELDDQLAMANRATTDANKSMNDLNTAQTKIKQLQQQLESATANIIDLQGDKKKLADKVNKLQIETENKFAGVALTGKRVIFLIDMSGSMDLLDENTRADTKWATVAETVTKVMRSLPDLEQFQVILFSNRMLYALGKEGSWLDFRRETSPDLVKKGLLAIKPMGDTNLHLGMEEAFKYRSKGMDTLYLFSDGLPTTGPGITESTRKQMREFEISTMLAKQIRDMLKRTWNGLDPKYPRVRINAIGFFYESPDVGAFLWAMARENDGSFVGMSRP